MKSIFQPPFKKLDKLVVQLEEKFGEEFRKLSNVERYECAMRFYNAQKTKMQFWRYTLQMIGALAGLWALLRTFNLV